MVEQGLRLLHDGIRELDVLTMQNRDLCKHQLVSITLWTGLFILAFPASAIFPREYDFPGSIEVIPDSDKYKLPGHDFPGHLVAIDDSDKLVVSYHGTKESFPVRLLWD